MYASDLAERFDVGELEAVQKEAASKGWDVISWGVDAHDALEYTVHRREGNEDHYLSLFLCANPDHSTDFALEYLLEEDAASRKTQLAAGKSRSFSSDDFAHLFERGLAWKLPDLSALSPLLAAVGAVDLALERVNEIVSNLRASELKDMVGPSQVRRLSEFYRSSALLAYNDLAKRGQAALGAAMLAVEKMAPAAEPQIERSFDSADEERRRKLRSSPVKKAVPLKNRAKKPSKRVSTDKPKKAPAKKLPAAAKHSPHN